MTAPVTPEMLDELEATLAGATPGHWVSHSDPGVKWDDPLACGYDSREHRRGPPYYCTGPRVASSEQAEADANAIAALRNAAPALIAAARERDTLAAENARLRAAAQALVDVLPKEVADRPKPWSRELRALLALLGTP